MRGEKLLKILEIINKEVGYNLSDLQDHLIGFFAAGYGASLSKIEYETDQAHKKRALHNIKQEQINRLKRLLYRLKKDEILERNKLTKKGLEKLDALRKKIGVVNYKKEPSENLVIVIFDIPEKLSNKRKWLRYNLKLLDYSMIQKSVWMGRIKLPTEFIRSVQEYELSSYIKIFTVYKEGTLL